MFKRLALPLFGGLILAASVYGQALGQQRTDSLGDPLPSGAIARLGTLRFKHDPERDPTIITAKFSPDGKKIASLVGTLRLWDADTGKQLAGPWTAAGKNYTTFAFSPDGLILAAATGQNGPQQGLEIILWDIAAGKQLQALSGHKEQIGALVFADAGKTLLSAGDGIVRWWDLADAKEQRSLTPFNEERLPAENGAKKIKTFFNSAFSPDAKSLAVQVGFRFEGGPMQQPKGLQNVNLEAVGFDLATGKMRWRTSSKAQNQNNGMRFAFSADSNRVAIGVGPNAVELRSAITGKLIATPPLDPQYSRTDTITGLALTTDGGTLAVSGNDSHVVLWNPEAGDTFRKIIGRMAQCWGNSTLFVTFSPDNTKLLVGADADLQIYDVATLKEVMPWDGHRGWVDYVAFSPDGQRLLTGSAQLNLHLKELVTWDVATWKRLSMTSNRMPLVKNIGFPSPEHTVFTGKNGPSRLEFFDLANGNSLGRIDADPTQDQAARGFFAPGSKLYVLAGKDEKGKVIERLYAVPTGKLLCELPSIVNIDQFTSYRPIAFSADERLVALFSRDDGLIRVIETANGKVLQKMGRDLSGQPQFKQGGANFCNLAFSPDGKLLVSSTMLDGFVRVWEVATGKERLQVQANELANGQVGPGQQQGPHFAWSPDGRMLAVAANKIKLWEVATRNVRREFNGHVGATRALAFSPDGQLLASGGGDTTVLIWPVTPAPIVAAQGTGEGIAEHFWQALAKDDATLAFAAICDLAAKPGEAIAIIQKHIKPATNADTKRIEDLITQLEDVTYKVRQKAMADLQKLGEQIVPAIDKALAANPPLETRLRLQELRDRMTGLVLQGERLQIVRAVEVLERIGSPEARQALQTLAGGAPGALTTAQAGAALERLTKSASQ